MAGGIEFDRGKFEELIVYIATRLPPRAALGRVKLAKLLMQSDFTAFVRLGRSITGATYIKAPFGHLAREQDSIEGRLEHAKRLAVVEEDYYGKTLKHISAQDDPDMTGFSEDEIAIIEGALRLYGHESASYLTELSHQEIGWIVADADEEIPYDAVFLERPNADDLAHASALAEQHGWD